VKSYIIQTREMAVPCARDLWPKKENFTEGVKREAGQQVNKGTRVTGLSRR